MTPVPQPPTRRRRPPPPDAGAAPATSPQGDVAQRRRRPQPERRRARAGRQQRRPEHGRRSGRRSARRQWPRRRAVSQLPARLRLVGRSAAQLPDGGDGRRQRTRRPLRLRRPHRHRDVGRELTNPPGRRPDPAAHPAVDAAAVAHQRHPEPARMGLRHRPARPGHDGERRADADGHARHPDRAVARRVAGAGRDRAALPRDRAPPHGRLGRRGRGHDGDDPRRPVDHHQPRGHRRRDQPRPQPDRAGRRRRGQRR